MDPIHLGKARMTKTPLPSLADEEWEALETKKLGRGEELFFFSFFFNDSWETLSLASLGLSTETNYCWLMDALSSSETSHLRSHLDLHVWMHHVRVLESWIFKHKSWLISTIKHIYVNVRSILQWPHASFGEVPTQAWIFFELNKIVSGSLV